MSESEARTELAQILGKHFGTSAGGDDYLGAMADILMERGWRKTQPAWSEGIPNDGEYEYVTTSDCDGSNRQVLRRKPQLTYDSGHHAWELVSESID